MWISLGWGVLGVKRAVISDLHSNLEGLEAVLADIRREGVDEICCLGDIVGYGPNPAECIDLVLQCQVCLLGNHDQGALFDPEGFNTGAERAIFWTREQLECRNGRSRSPACGGWIFSIGCPATIRTANSCSCTARPAIP